MAPVAISDTTTVPEMAIVPTKAPPIDKVDEVEKEVTPLEAISHGDVLPGTRTFCFRCPLPAPQSSNPSVLGGEKKILINMQGRHPHVP